MTESTPARPTPHELSTDPELSDWRVALGHLHAVWETSDFAEGAALVARVAALADELDHHPDVDLRYDRVAISTISHDVGELTRRDRRLAIGISDLARELGLTARPDLVNVLEIGLDVMDQGAVAPFWAAVLGYEVTEDGDLVADPLGRNVSVWFQQMDEPRFAERGRFHLDITVPHDQAEQRVADAVAAGGRILTTEFAPSWWVLADPEGNEVCVCTWQNRAGSGEDGGDAGGAASDAGRPDEAAATEVDEDLATADDEVNDVD